MSANKISILLFISVLIIGLSCTKDESLPPTATPAPTDTTAMGDSSLTDTIPVQLSMMDSLAGHFSGFRYYMGEFIDCPGNQLPCNFTYEYDTLEMVVQIVNVGDTALQIIDLEDGYIDRTIQLDENLEYDGYIINDAPEGFYELHYTEAPFDSLIIRTMEGGGSVQYGGGTYYFYSYDLLRE